MTKPHITDDYFMVQELETDPVQIWLDWEMATDGDPNAVVQATRVGNDLQLHTQDSNSRPARALVDLDDATWESLEARGGEEIICGPSGILGRRRFSMR